jgi:hypothetical protein
LMALCIVNMSICYEFLGQYPKALEASKHAQWIVTTFTSGNDQLARNVLAFRESMRARYGPTVKELAEIERIVFHFFETKRGALESEEDSLSSDRTWSSVDEGVLEEALKKEKKDDEEDSSCEVVVEIGKENKTLEKFKRLLIDGSESQYTEMYLRAHPSHKATGSAWEVGAPSYAPLVVEDEEQPDVKSHEGEPRNIFHLKERIAKTDFKGTSFQESRQGFFSKHPSEHHSSAADPGSLQLAKGAKSPGHLKKTGSTVGTLSRFGDEYSPRALTSNKCKTI